MKAELVSIGEPLVEFNQTRQGERDYLQGFGGDTSNVAIAAARQGARAAYFTRLGDDPFARLFLDLWREEGVDASSVELDRDAFTGVYFVQHGPAGHAFHYLRAGSAASRMRSEDLPMDLIRNARIVHASGISMAISQSALDSVLFGFQKAKQGGVKVSFDSNLRLKLWPLERAREAMARAIALADYFFPSLEDAQALTGESDVKALLAWAHGLGAKNVFLKLGPRGVVVSDGREATEIAGLKVKNVDATGAGDCFCGAALARLAAGDSPQAAARYANVAAALKTTGFGAVAPLPRAQQVVAFLESMDR